MGLDGCVGSTAERMRLDTRVGEPEHGSGPEVDPSAAGRRHMAGQVEEPVGVGAEP